MSPAIKKEFTKAHRIDVNTSTNQKRRSRGGVVSLRVSDDEKAALVSAAGGMALNAYLRGVVFRSAAGTAPKAKPARARGANPVKDFEALGRVLAALGRSGIPDALERLLAAHTKQAQRPSGLFNACSSVASTKVDAALLQACADIAAMRVDLVKALGLKAQGGAVAP